MKQNVPLTRKLTCHGIHIDIDSDKVEDIHSDYMNMASKKIHFKEMHAVLIRKITLPTQMCQTSIGIFNAFIINQLDTFVLLANDMASS